MFGQLKELTEALQAPSDLSLRDKFISPECQMFEDFVLRVSENFLILNDPDSLFKALQSLNSMFYLYGFNSYERNYIISFMNLCLSELDSDQYFII